MTCGGSFPSERFAPLPAAATASSTASLGTEEASTPSEIQSVRRPPAATTPLCVMTSDLAGPAASRRRDAPEQDQTRPGGIELRPSHLAKDSRLRGRPNRLGGCGRVEERGRRNGSDECAAA